ncbi:MAG: diguanylate cyclase [Campylobacterota bacterium]|nr:diguanylate cyclase [Campylobacterota bacterium]
MMTTVEDICTKDVVTVSINDTIEYAIKEMAKYDVRDVIISDEKDRYYIFTTSDAIEFKIQNISIEKKLSDIILNRIKTIDSSISVLEIINQENDSNEYMLIMKDDKVFGILSKTDIVNNMDPKVLMKKQTIGKIILQYKAISIFQDEATVNAIKLMKYQDIDSVIIIDTNHKPVGIFTTKDFLNLMNSCSDLNKPVRSFMSSPLETVNYDIKIFEAIEFIREKHFKRLIVTDNENKIKGVITQSELLRIVNNKWMEIIKEKGLELLKINQKLLEKTASLEEKASQDFLTKLYNRRKFDSILEYEITQVQRDKNTKLSFLILDIDNFKYVNDTFGHDVGDKILQELANILNVASRKSDVISRWGGEEFSVALPKTNIENALLVAQKIRLTIENYIFSNNLRITCSFGVSTYHPKDLYKDLFKRADEALYKAKNTGKNKVVIEAI